MLRFVGDLTEQQTADALKVPIGTVKSRVARALAGPVTGPPSEKRPHQQLRPSPGVRPVPADDLSSVPPASDILQLARTASRRRKAAISGIAGVVEIAVLVAAIGVFTGPATWNGNPQSRISRHYDNESTRSRIREG